MFLLLPKYGVMYIEVEQNVLTLVTQISWLISHQKLRWENHINERNSRFSSLIYSLRTVKYIQIIIAFHSITVKSFGTCKQDKMYFCVAKKIWRVFWFRANKEIITPFVYFMKYLMYSCQLSFTVSIYLLFSKIC